MATGALLLQALAALKYANGAYAIVACAALAVLLPLRSRPASAAVAAVLGGTTAAAFCAFCALAFAYALHPNFLDHAEPAMADLGMALLEGRPLYPDAGAPTFHGLLYGPLVAEIQAAAILIGTSLAGLPVILSSKLSGVLAFLLASALFFRLTLASGGGLARAYYVLFLLPFGVWAFWNRCEPLFLLLATAGLQAAARPRRQALLVIGVCAGLASGLKLHGCLYLAPAVLLLIFRGGFALDAILIPAAAAAATFLALFLPANVSLAAFFEWLLRAASHGLSGELFLRNLVFFGALWSPLVVARARALRSPEVLAMAALQLGVALIGAKPGAGIHHLLPFIPANALLFARHAEGGERTAGLRLVWAAALLPGLAVLAWVSLGMAQDWRAYERAAQELARIQMKTPDVVMGAAGSSTYRLTFLRPMLELMGPPQIEYSSFMDLHLTGASDAPLRRAFERCDIAHLAVPRREAPFTVASYYAPGMPMFSDELRATFQRRYAKIGQGAWYDVYECRP